MGESGSGKSTSIKTLDPKETVIFNILGKRLPFKGSAASYNEDNKNLFKIDDWETLISFLDGVNQDAPHVKNIVIDDKQPTFITTDMLYKISGIVSSLNSVKRGNLLDNPVLNPQEIVENA